MFILQYNFEIDALAICLFFFLGGGVNQSRITKKQLNDSDACNLIRYKHAIQVDHSRYRYDHSKYRQKYRQYYSQ